MRADKLYDLINQWKYGTSRFMGTRRQFLQYWENLVRSYEKIQAHIPITDDFKKNRVNTMFINIPEIAQIEVNERMLPMGIRGGATFRGFDWDTFREQVYAILDRLDEADKRNGTDSQRRGLRVHQAAVFDPEYDASISMDDDVIVVNTAQADYYFQQDSQDTWGCPIFDANQASSVGAGF